MDTKVDEAVVLHLLQKLQRYGPLSPWDLINYQDKTSKEYYDIIEHMQNHNLSKLVDKKMTLTEEGLKFLRTATGDREFVEFNFEATDCERKGYFAEFIAKHADLLEKYKKVLEKRPPPSETYDQTSMSAEDAMLRVGFFQSRTDLLNRELLHIGDYDCLSILEAMTLLPKRVVVLDIDDRLINYINETAADLKISHILKAEKFDVRKPLPEHYRRAFDLFSCDPVETLEGIKLFLSRGSSGLKGRGSVCYFGLTTLEASRKKWFDIQKVMMDMNFVVTDAKRNYNVFPNTGLEANHTITRKIGFFPDCEWYWCALLRCELVDDPKPAVEGAYDELGPDIYVDDEAWATPVPE